MTENSAYLSFVCIHKTLANNKFITVPTYKLLRKCSLSLSGNKQTILYYKAFENKSHLMATKEGWGEGMFGNRN